MITSVPIWVLRAMRVIRTRPSANRKVNTKPMPASSCMRNFLTKKRISHNVRVAVHKEASIISVRVSMASISMVRPSTIRIMTAVMLIPNKTVWEMLLITMMDFFKKKNVPRSAAAAPRQTRMHICTSSPARVCTVPEKKPKSRFAITTKKSKKWLPRYDSISALLRNSTAVRIEHRAIKGFFDLPFDFTGQNVFHFVGTLMHLPHVHAEGLSKKTFPESVSAHNLSGLSSTERGNFVRSAFHNQPVAPHKKEQNQSEQRFPHAEFLMQLGKGIHRIIVKKEFDHVFFIPLVLEAPFAHRFNKVTPFRAKQNSAQGEHRSNNHNHGAACHRPAQSKLILNPCRKIEGEHHAARGAHAPAHKGKEAKGKERTGKKTGKHGRSNHHPRHEHHPDIP